jgi:hypothetical protein
MEKQTQNKNTSKSIETLIDIQWEIITELHKKLKNPDLTTIEYTKAASALGCHISILNKLLNKNRENVESNEQNLGDFVRSVTPRTHRRWDYSIWKRRLSLRR